MRRAFSIIKKGYFDRITRQQVTKLGCHVRAVEACILDTRIEIIPH
jgi:hypothetical protein